MNGQCGFDFGGETVADDFSEHPAGAWNGLKFTTAQHVALLNCADAAARGIVGPGRALFCQGIKASQEQHADMLSRRSFDDAAVYSLWRPSFEPTREALEAFIAHCLIHAGATYSGIEYKTRNECKMLTAAMFVPGVGALVVRQWGDVDVLGIDYHPWRDAFFMDSYRDSLPSIFAPHAVWAGSYCADKLAYANNGVASVPTFAVNGREYINDGSTGKGRYQECEGWTFRPKDDWRGPTYNYQTQCKVWDEGRTERGDRRGLVVRVRGQLCVVDGVAKIYDDNATERYLVTETDEDTDVDAMDFEEEIVETA